MSSVVGRNVVLSTGRKMPLLGLGTWMVNGDDARRAVTAAITAGYRLIDTAMAYQNEKEVGEAIRSSISNGIVARDELFVTTKIWMTCLHPEETELCLRKSLKDLQLDYVDLYLVHMPTGFKKDMSGFDPVPIEETWKGMEKVYNLGLTKAIGVANYSSKQVQRLIDCCTVVPHSVQVECQLFFPQFELHDLCKKHNMNFTAFSCLGSPGRDRTKFADSPNALEDENVLAFAKKYDRAPANIILRWLVQRGITVIPKSVNEARIRANGDIWDFSLTDSEMNTLNNTKHRQRIFFQEFMIGHPEDSIVDER